MNIFLFCVVYIVICVKGELNINLQGCPRGPNYDYACIFQAIQNAVQNLKDGCEGVLSIDPLEIPYRVYKITTPKLDAKMVLTNGKARGLSKFGFTNIKFLEHSNTLGVSFPHVKITGNLLLNITYKSFNMDQVNGTIKIETENLGASGTAYSHVVTTNNVEYLQFADANVALNVTNYKVSVSIPEHQELEQVINNDPIFQNNMEIVASVRPEMEKACRKIVLNWLHSVVHVYPYDRIAYVVN